jgi:phosphoglycerate kinase
MNKKTIRDIKLDKKRVLVRVDYNVSLLNGIRVGDDLRIRQTLSTLEYLLGKGCKLFLVSHLGRPKGKWTKKFTLKPVVDHLEKVMDRKVNLIGDKVGSRQLMKKVNKAEEGSINILENIRFYKEEERNDEDFSEKLSQVGEVFVNDAFGVDHRAHASTVGVTKFLPSVAGFLLEKEVKVIGKSIKKPKKPMVAIIGGAKAETKITLVDRLLEKADTCIVGGGVANTFFKAFGYEVGKSLVDHEMVELAKRLFWKASRSQTRMLLPSDVVVGSLSKNVSYGTVEVNKVTKGMQILDIGPRTQAEFGAAITNAQTIIWNGPMGVYESEKFQLGTDFIYHAIAENKESQSIVGGGDTLAALKNKDYLESIDHVSTGGGAMLEFIEEGTLPAIEALMDK